MAPRKAPEQATLLDVLIDGFEKNEVLEGFHWRQLPLPDPGAGAHKFAEFLDEARRWKGEPTRRVEDADRRLAAWDDLEIRQVGRGILVRVRASGFATWWHEDRTWMSDPLDAVFDWVEAERAAKVR